MKYQINESRLVKIIENYLSSELGNLKLVEKDDETDWYVNESGEPLVVTSKGTFKDTFILSRTIYDNLEQLFGLDTTDDLQKHLRRYFYLKWGLDLEMVYTFNRENLY
jgi:hypothetical protein